MPPSPCSVGLNAEQQDGEYGKQMDASIKIQGQGTPTAELLHQVALLSPGAASYKTRKNICFSRVGVCVCVCVCEEMTQNTQIHTAVFSGSDFHSSQSDCRALS